MGGDMIEVIEPDSLRQTVAEWAKAIWDMYEWQYKNSII